MYFNLYRKKIINLRLNSLCPFHVKEREVCLMGKDRQERKLKQSKRVESDRDQALHYPGATKMQSPEEARDLNNNKL